MKKLAYLVIILLVSSVFYSCSENVTNVINDIISNKITVKDRLDSAFAQASRKYSPSVKLVLIFGKNVIFEGTDAGKTDITGLSALSNPDTIGAWLYIFKKPGSDTLAVYTPNPTPGARDCIELTSIFNFNTILSLIADTSAKNIVSGCWSTLATNTNFFISTSSSEIVNSDVSLGYSNTANPVIKFNSSFIPTSSTNNGQSFFASGTNKTVNMFLIPALGTLKLPDFVTSLINFPSDLWIVNYKKSNGTTTENYIAATVTKSSQNMTINIPPTFSSKVINLSKY
jgi:hypothetical protein